MFIILIYWVDQSWQDLKIIVLINSSTNMDYDPLKNCFLELLIVAWTEVKLSFPDLLTMMVRLGLTGNLEVRKSIDQILRLRAFTNGSIKESRTGEEGEVKKYEKWRQTRCYSFGRSICHQAEELESPWEWKYGGEGSNLDERGCDRVWLRLYSYIFCLGSVGNSYRDKAVREWRGSLLERWKVFCIWVNRDVELDARRFILSWLAGFWGWVGG